MLLANRLDWECKLSSCRLFHFTDPERRETSVLNRKHFTATWSGKMKAYLWIQKSNSTQGIISVAIHAWI